MADKKRLRYVNMMVEQQIRYLGMSLSEFTDKVKALGASKFAIIAHDRDAKPDGTPVELHVHVALHFDNAREISAVAKKLGLSPQYIQKWDGDRRRSSLIFAIVPLGRRGVFSTIPRMSMRTLITLTGSRK